MLGESCWSETCGVSQLNRFSTRALVMVFLFMLVGACGALESVPVDNGATAIDTATASAVALATVEPQIEVETIEPKATETAQPDSAASDTTAQLSGDDGSGAVVRIETVGAFEALWQGLPYVSTGYGSGFLVSEDGQILTNAHIVVGAALLRVFVPGEVNPISGRVVASDECSDLALIKVEGTDLPVLRLATGAPVLDSPVRALGYPYGAADLWESSGTILDTDGYGASGWAALGHTIQHSAEMHPGNSGGPLLDANNFVVGVNYAGDSSGSGWAVPINLVTPVLSQMRVGKVASFVTGINGQAFVSQVSDATGVFVSSVATGSAAGLAGVLAGDLLLELERLPLAQDGTLRDYCDVLRSHSQSDVLDLRVYRRSEYALLAGQLNGNQLEVVAGQLPEPEPPQFAPDYVPARQISDLVAGGLPDLDELASKLHQDVMQQAVAIDDFGDQRIFMSWKWCADSVERLAQNLDHFTVMFVVDGVSYTEDAVHRTNTQELIDVAGKTGVSSQCSTSRIALEQWDSGVHRAVVSAYLDSEISDGWSTFSKEFLDEKFYEVRVSNGD